MKNKNVRKLIILALCMSFTLSAYNNFGFVLQESNVQLETDIKNPRNAAFWIATFIHVDGNWSETAITYDWCSGDGSWTSPYTIENVDINASTSSTGIGIFIQNSKNDYFIIRNCTVYNAVNGIRLDNTDQGTLTGNNCSNNNNWGIWLTNNCDNNTISNNIAERNGTGIALLTNCDINTISNNIADRNSGSGIYLRTHCFNNTLSGNSADNNNDNGIYIENSWNNRLLGNTANNNNWGIYLNGLYGECDYTVITGNIANYNNERGIVSVYYSSYLTISENTANYNGDYGIVFDGLFSTISRNTASYNRYGIYLWGDNMVSCESNEVFANEASNNLEYGIYLEYSIYNSLSGNAVVSNYEYGIYLSNNNHDNDILYNYLYLTYSYYEIYVGGTCSNTRIQGNIFIPLVVGFEIEDYGVNTIISNNFYWSTPPELVVEVYPVSFSPTEFIFIINMQSYPFLPHRPIIKNIECLWNGITVPSNNIIELEMGLLYKISLPSIFVEPGQDPILLSMTIDSASHQVTYYETYIAVEPPESINYLHIEILEHLYTLDHFNLTFFVCNVSGKGVDSATIQIWWNGTDISTDVQNLGNGLFFISLEPITVAPGEDPILLNMTVSASGYYDEYFEAYIAVDPDVIDKKVPKKKVPEISGYSLILLLVVISIVSIALIRKRIFKK